MVKACLASGVPKESDYKKLVESRAYLDMDEFSSQFLIQNNENLKGYASKWVSNPLRQWSRKWEYPFVLERLAPVLKKNGSAVILDAGSGVSFFPYYLLSKYPQAEIHCADYDPKLGEVYKRINEEENGQVQFKHSDLRRLGYKAGMFDAIYCVSVLEHTDCYAEIIEGFAEMLAPGGKLIISFDVSLDGTRDVSIARAEELLCLLADKLEVDGGASFELENVVAAPGCLTTLIAREIDTDCLPWKAPGWVYRLHSFFKGKGLVAWPPPLTVYCLSLTKRS